MYVLLIVLTILAAVLLIGVVLIQKSKGGGLSSAFARLEPGYGCAPHQQLHREAHMEPCRRNRPAGRALNFRNAHNELERRIARDSPRSGADNPVDLRQQRSRRSREIGHPRPGSSRQARSSRSGSRKISTGPSIFYPLQRVAGPTGSARVAYFQNHSSQ